MTLAAPSTGRAQQVGYGTLGVPSASARLHSAPAVLVYPELLRASCSGDSRQPFRVQQDTGWGCALRLHEESPWALLNRGAFVCCCLCLSVFIMASSVFVWFSFVVAAGSCCASSFFGLLHLYGFLLRWLERERRPARSLQHARCLVCIPFSACAFVRTQGRGVGEGWHVDWR